MKNGLIVQVPARGLAAILLSAFIASAPTSALDQPIGILSASHRGSPRVPFAALRPGSTNVSPGAFLYVPPAPVPGPRPLLLVLPGTGGHGRDLIAALRPYADHYGFLLLGFTPKRSNFDGVDNFFDDYEAGRANARLDWPQPRFGPDVARIDRALQRVLDSGAVDSRRIGLLGFSHGASYALMLGTANPRLFAAVEALSPGILILPPQAKGGQAVFLAHGRGDAVQPFRRTACSFVPRLGSLGYRVRFSPFDGDHSSPARVLEAAIRHFLAAMVPEPGATPPKPRAMRPDDLAALGCARRR